MASWWESQVIMAEPDKISCTTTYSTETAALLCAHWWKCKAHMSAGSSYSTWHCALLFIMSIVKLLNVYGVRGKCNWRLGGLVWGEIQHWYYFVLCQRLLCLFAPQMTENVLLQKRQNKSVKMKDSKRGELYHITKVVVCFVCIFTYKHVHQIVGRYK